MSVTDQAAPPREEQAPLSANLGWLLSQAAHALMTDGEQTGGGKAKR